MASYWGTYSSNHVELAFPYYIPLIDYYPNGMRSAAAKNCSGLSLPAHIGPWGTAGSTGDVYMGTGGEHARLQAQVLSLGCRSHRWRCVVPAGDWGQDMDGVFSATLMVLQ